MCEKIYTLLLRLYPPCFRKEYEAEVLQFFRDRFRDERGFFKRARLWCDLVVDVFAGLLPAYRNSYAATEPAPLSFNAAGIPSFKILDEERLGRGSILMGSAISLIVLAAFASLLSRPIENRALPGSNGRLSPIEAVMHRLNQAPSPDPPTSSFPEAATPASVQMSGSQVEPSTPGTSSPNVSGVTGADLKQRIVQIMSGHVARKLNFSRKLLLTAAGSVAITVPIVFGLVHSPQSWAQSPANNTAQDLSGTWQGTLHAERDLRTVVKITKARDGAYKAQWFSIDQPGQPAPADSVTLDGSTFKMTINLIGGSYEGKLSADGQSISGTWTQGQPFPLVLTRATPETAWTIPPPPPPILPMADDADPSLEVATIKLSPPDQKGRIYGLNGHEFITRNTNLNFLLAIAYGVHRKQIVNAPDWANSVLYDITGIPDAPGAPSQKQVGILIKKLLVDRFRLKTHLETRVLSVYAITVAKDGPKMTKSTGPATAPQAFGLGGFGNLTVRNQTMNDFAKGMQRSVMDRPVVDQTGLTGRYDFQLKWTPDDSQFTQFPTVPPTSDNPNAPPNLYTAIQQQLGLKIEPAKAPDVVLVIDHIEKPSAD